MKVLHCFSNYLPKTQNWAFELLRHSKHEKIIFFKERSNFEKFNKLNAKMLKPYFSTYNTYPFIKRAINKLINQNLFDKEICKHFSENSCNLVHFHFADIASQCQSYLFKNDIPFVVSFYGWDYEKLPHLYPEFNKKYRLLFKQAEKIIVEGPHGKKILELKGCPPNKIAIIKLGVSKNSFGKMNFNNNKSNSFVQVASYRKKKGQLDVLEAINLLKKQKGINVTCAFFGDKPDKLYFRQLVKYADENNLNSQVSFGGPIAYSNLTNLFQDYSFFVHPSQYTSDKDCEGGAPTILFNAAAAGLPCISTTHCDIPSVIVNNSTGWLSSEQNKQMLANNMYKAVLLNEKSYNNFSKNSINHIKNNYLIEENALALDTLYNEII